MDLIENEAVGLTLTKNKFTKALVLSIEEDTNGLERAALQRRTIDHGFSRLAPLSCKGEGKATFWREDHITVGIVPHGG